MKAKLYLICAALLLMMSACAVNSLPLKNVSHYDTTRKEFVDEKDIKNAWLYVGLGGYIVSSKESTLYIRKMKAPHQQQNTTYVDALCMGTPHRIMIYTDSGYFDRNETVFIIYDLESKFPVIKVIVDMDKKSVKVPQKILLSNEQVTQQMALSGKKVPVVDKQQRN